MTAPRTSRRPVADFAPAFRAACQGHVAFFLFPVKGIDQLLVFFFHDIPLDLESRGDFASLDLEVPFKEGDLFDLLVRGEVPGCSGPPPRAKSGLPASFWIKSFRLTVRPTFGLGVFLKLFEVRDDQSSDKFPGFRR